MVDTVATQIIQDGGRSAVVKTTVVIGAGAGGNPPPPQEVTLVDVSGLAPDVATGRACTGATLQNVIFANVGVAVELQWKANANVLIFDFPSITKSPHVGTRCGCRPEFHPPAFAIVPRIVFQPQQSVFHDQLTLMELAPDYRPSHIEKRPQHYV